MITALDHSEPPSEKLFSQFPLTLSDFVREEHSVLCWRALNISLILANKEDTETAAICNVTPLFASLYVFLVLSIYGQVILAFYFQQQYKIFS